MFFFGGTTAPWCDTDVVTQGGHREFRHRVREEKRARGLHEGLRLRVMDRGRHPHSEEGGQVQKEVLLEGQSVWRELNNLSSVWLSSARGCVSAEHI